MSPIIKFQLRPTLPAMRKFFPAALDKSWPDDETTIAAEAATRRASNLSGSRIYKSSHKLATISNTYAILALSLTLLILAQAIRIENSLNPSHGGRSGDQPAGQNEIQTTNQYQDEVLNAPLGRRSTPMEADGPNGQPADGRQLKLQLARLLRDFPSQRNARLLDELRRRQLDFRIFYPEQVGDSAAHSGARQRRAGQVQPRGFSTRLGRRADSASNDNNWRDHSKRSGKVSSNATGNKEAQQVSGHYNRTNVIIRAFNYKFRLDLELNNNLFGPNLIQKHFLPKGGQQISSQRVEHCYYHGRTQADARPQAIGAFRTCNGLSGIIHVNNESFVILPFYDADVGRKHPHIIYRYHKSASTSDNSDNNSNNDEDAESRPRQAHRRECGNSRLHEWALRQYNKLASVNSPGSQLNSSLLARNFARRNASIWAGSELGAAKAGNSCGDKRPRGGEQSASCGHEEDESAEGRASFEEAEAKVKAGVEAGHHQQLNRFSKRDVSLTEKYIELALVLSQDMFDKRNSSSRLEVLQDAIQIVNCLDLYFKSANTRVSLIYVETWAHGDQIELSGDVKQTLYNFLEYSTRKLYKVSMDAAHLLTGGHLRQFDGAEAGMSIPDSICSSRAVSVSQDSSVFEPFIAAATIAHMLGHNLGMEHDESGGQLQVQAPEQPAGLQVPAVAGAIRSELLPVGVEELGGPARAAPARGKPGQQQQPAHRKHLPHHQDQEAEEHQGEEHEDELRGRSLRSSDDDNLSSSDAEPCRANCLMSERFTFPPSPVSFGDMIQQRPQTAANNSQPTNDSLITWTDLDPGAESEFDPDGVDPTAAGASVAPPPTNRSGLGSGAAATSLPFRFSRQSIEMYHKLLRLGHGICLFNKPNQLEDFKTCGNGIVDKDEDCDCGTFQECLENDSCCDPITCRFKVEAECINGACCDRCKLRPRGFICRKARGECDLAEQCDGKSGQCAPDVYKQNGYPCAQNTGHCLLGQCPTHDNQCSDLWGSDAKKSDRLCYTSFNTNGTIRGNCGYDSALRKYKRCDQEHMMCGTLQCQLGDMKPVTASIESTGGKNLASKFAAGSAAATTTTTTTKTTPAAPPTTVHEFSKKVLHAHDGSLHECKVITGTSQSQGFASAPATSPDHQQQQQQRAGQPGISYVRDGSKCATNKVCFNQTCQPIELVYRDSFELCPKDEKGRQCSGNGVCSTANRCHCDPNWTGHDCSQRQIAASLSASAPVAQSPGARPALHLSDDSGAPATQPLDSAAAPSEKLGLSNQQPISAMASAVGPPPPTQPPVAAPDTTTGPPTSKPIPSPAPSNNGTTMSVPDKKRHDALGAPTLVFILVSIVAAVYVGFALMANCYRRKGFYKPDKVLRHHQMNCKLDAIRSSFIAKRLADADAISSNCFDINGPSSMVQPMAAPLPEGVDLMSPYVSPLSAQAPASCQYFVPPSVQPNQLGVGAELKATPASDTINFTSNTSQRQAHYIYQPQAQQQQHQHQIAASVHYFDEQQQAQQLIPTSTNLSGDHIPLLMAAEQPVMTNQRPINQPVMRTFASGPSVGRQPTRPGNYEPHWTLTTTTGRQRAPARSSRAQSQINRATSLGNVNRQLQHQHQHQLHLHQHQLRTRAIDLEASDEEDNLRRLSAHRALATPLRVATLRASPAHRHRAGQLEDSCSAPSSPEHKESSYWVEFPGTNLAGRHHSHAAHPHLHRQQPGGAGYHEQVIFDALTGDSLSGLIQASTNPLGSGGQQRRLEGVASKPVSRQQSMEQRATNGVEADDDGDDDEDDADDDEGEEEDDVEARLPPLPPPPAGHLLDGLSHGAGQETGDESEPSSTLQQRYRVTQVLQHKQPPSGPGQQPAASTRTLKRIPLNTGDAQPPTSQYINHAQLSLIAQLQQLEQVQSLHQKQQSAGDKAKSSSLTNAGDSLHEFFSLPLSVQLSALLARSLGESRDSSSQAPIDELLNNLNNSSVANMSRKNFSKSGQQQQQSYSAQQAAGSRGGTMKRHQMKLQNLQGLISRLQKLHNQTALQQQLEELGGELEATDFGQTRPASRQSGSGRAHRAQSVSRPPNRTADDLFEVAHQVGRARRSVRRLVQRSSRDAAASSKNESIYSMSDSEDGVFVSRTLLGNYVGQQRAAEQPAASEPKSAPETTSRDESRERRDGRQAEATDETRDNQTGDEERRPANSHSTSPAEQMSSANSNDSNKQRDTKNTH